MPRPTVNTKHYHYYKQCLGIEKPLLEKLVDARPTPLPHMQILRSAPMPSLMLISRPATVHPAARPAAIRPAAAATQLASPTKSAQRHRHA